MTKIKLLPEGKSIEIDETKSLLEGLRKAGIFIKSSCGGKATCSDCIVKIKGGSDHLAPPEFNELRLIGNVFHITKERLACQTFVAADAEVSIDISAHDPKAIAEEQSQRKFANSKLLLKKKAEVEKTRLEREEKRQAKFEKREDAKGSKGGNRRPKHKNFSTTKKKLF